MSRVDETISVSVNEVGEPIGFSWAGRCYLVSAKPLRWFARKEWWVEAARVQRGIGAGVLELEMWRLVANDGSGAGQFELIHNSIEGSWKLLRYYLAEAA
ncbi:MAG: hypothetical protein RL556_297 [Actinomycetota bacterium]|jgi:hypothetical protein